MGSDFAMEAWNRTTRPNIIEWEGDILTVTKDFPISGYSKVWSGKVDLDNPTEVSLFKQAFGPIPSKPEPVVPTYTQIVDVLRKHFDYHNQNAIDDLWEIIEDVNEFGIDNLRK